MDGTLKLTESRAIAMYLVNQYGKSDELYPKLALDRAKVDEMLYFDATTISRKYQELMVRYQLIGFVG